MSRRDVRIRTITALICNIVTNINKNLCCEISSVKLNMHAIDF